MKQLLIVLIVIWCSIATKAQEKLTVAVAANMQYTMNALVTAYNKTNNTRIEIITGASGKLSQQILNGAPFDIFVAADEIFPQKIAEGGLALQPPTVYARGALVLWSLSEDVAVSKNLKCLLKNNVKAIAIANPSTAPYGRAAVASMKKQGIYQQITGKLVTGESITQASQFIATQNADIGFTAKSIVLSPNMTGKGTWAQIDAKDYPPINQAAVLLTHAKHHQKTAKGFYDFLFSENAKTIYRKYGYIVE